MARRSAKSMDYDVVIVGAGPAGLSAAIRLKQIDPDLPSSCWKRAPRSARISSRARCSTRSASTLLPDWRERGAPVTTGHRRPLLLPRRGRPSPASPNWPMPKLMSNHGNYIVSMGNVCRWLASEAEALGVEIFPAWPPPPSCGGQPRRGVVAGEFGLEPTAPRTRLRARHGTARQIRADRRGACAAASSR